MTDGPPKHVRNEMQADIAAFKRLVRDADVVCVGRDPEYTPDAPRLRKQFEDGGNDD